jgi:hypothetical protein
LVNPEKVPSAVRDERDAVYPTRRHQPWVIEYLGQTLLIRK